LLIPDGVYLSAADPPYFRTLGASTSEEIQAPVQRIAARLRGHLERRGLLMRDMENNFLALDSEESAYAARS